MMLLLCPVVETRFLVLHTAVRQLPVVTSVHMVGLVIKFPCFVILLVMYIGRFAELWI